VSISLVTVARRLFIAPASVNPFVSVNRESSRDSTILAGVSTRKRAIRNVGLAGRDARFRAAVNKKHAKTKDLTQNSFEAALKSSPWRARTATLGLIRHSGRCRLSYQGIHVHDNACSLYRSLYKTKWRNFSNK